ncbi:hypothetical protein HDU76_013345 [Blyttiomyces sp. JEL0837]|nr:hypothetical protein HDU76_013345 [Blyttiomyces sp. JEL0837]
MFIVAGNGDTSPIKDPLPGNKDALVYGMSVINLKLDSATRAVTAQDFFMPYNYQALNGGDRDFGSGGITLLPSQFGTKTASRVAVAAGKSGIVYFLNVDNLGGFKQGAGLGDNVLQAINGPNAVYSQPGAYPYEGGYVYVNPVGFPMQVYKFGVSASGSPEFSFVAQTPINNRFGVGSPQVTSLKNQPGTALTWHLDISGTLFAYNAVPNADGTMTKVFSDSIPGTYPTNKFIQCAIGNGKVYVVTSDGRLAIYGSPTNQPLTAPEADFGKVFIGTSQKLSINFTAQQTVTITGFALSNTNFTVLSPVSSNFPITLTTGKNLTFVVEFKSDIAGAITGSLNLNTSAGTNALAYASLRATSIYNAPFLTLTPNAVTFSGVVTGSGPVTANGIISNTGYQNLTITNIVLPDLDGPFKVLNPPAVGTVLGSEASVTISIVFNPTVDGSFDDKFVVGSDGGEQNILLTGSSAGPPVLKLYTSKLDGSVVEGLGKLHFIFDNSKLPTGGNIIASATALVEGQQVPAFSNVTIPVTFTAPRTQLNAPPSNSTAIWIVNTDDLVAGLQTFTFNGTVVSNTLPPQYNSWTYIGCYADGTPRVLPSGQTNGNSAVMTIELCLSTCAGLTAGNTKVYQYAGLEYARECWCGNAAPTSAMVNTCTSPCKGNSSEICGNGGAIDVWSVLGVPVPVTSTTVASSTSSTSVASSTTSSTSSTVSSSTTTSASSASSSTTDVPSPTTGVVVPPSTTSSTSSSTSTDSSSTTSTTSTSTSTVPSSTTSSTSSSSSTAPSSTTLTTSSTTSDTATSTATSTSSSSISATSTTSTSTQSSTTSSTSTSSPNTTPITNSWSYKGCFADAATINGTALPRLFSSASGNAGTQLKYSNWTMETCFPACLVSNAKYVYAGLEYGGECWCGASITGGVQVPDSDCSTPCKLNTSEICGAGKRMSLWQYMAAAAAGTSAALLNPTPLTSCASTSLTGAYYTFTAGYDFPALGE